MDQIYKFIGTALKGGVWEDKNPDEYSSLSYSDFENATEKPTEENKKDFYIMPDLMSGSDGSGSCVEKANHKAFLEMFAEHEGVHDVYGYCGSYAVAIRLDVSEQEEIADVLNGLENYAVMDDDALNEIEMDAHDDAWKGWAESDTKSALIKELEKTFTDPEEYIDQIEDLRQLFEQAREEVNEYWEIESGANAWIKVEKVVPVLAEFLIVWHTPLEVLPLLKTRKWVVDSVEKEFTERLQLCVERNMLPTLIGIEWKSERVQAEFERLLRGAEEVVREEGIQCVIQF